MTVIVDSPAPRAEIISPAEGQHACGKMTVTGTATDIDMESYRLYCKEGTDPDGPAPWIPVWGPEMEAVARGLLGEWDTNGLAAGDYLLRLEVVDKSGKTATSDRVVYVSNEPPIAEITFPQEDSVTAGMLEVIGNACGPTFSSYRLEYKAGHDPEGSSGWIPIGPEHAEQVEDDVLETWDTAKMSDGPYMIRLSVSALPGVSSSTCTVPVNTDNTLPVARISSPDGSRTLTGLIRVEGTASNRNFKEYRLEYSSVDSPSEWQLIGNPVCKQVYSGLLGWWNTELLADGSYYLRLTATDIAGNESRSTVAIDLSNPPGYVITEERVEPGSAACLEPGETVDFMLIGTDTQGNDHLLPASYEVLGGIGEIDASGQFTATTRGHGAVRVTHGSFIYEAPVSVVTMVSSTVLSEDATWGPDGNPWVVDGWVVVPEGITLTLEPGTIVKFIRGGFFVEGTLVSSSPDGEPEIILTSIEDDSVMGDTNADRANTVPNPGDWSTVYYQTGASPAVIKRTSVLYSGAETKESIIGHRYVSAMSSIMTRTEGSYFSGCTIRYSATDGVWCLNGNTTVEDCLFGDVEGTSVKASSHGEGQHTVIRGSEVSGGSMGIMVMGGSVTLDGNTISDTGSWGAMLSSSESLTARSNSFSSCNGGIYIYPSGPLTVNWNTFTSCSFGVMISTETIPGSLDISNNVFTSCPYGIYARAASEAAATAVVSSNIFTCLDQSGTIALYVGVPADELQVTQNDISGYGLGIMADGATWATIENNTVQGAGTGIAISNYCGSGDNVGEVVTCRHNTILGCALGIRFSYDSGHYYRDTRVIEENTLTGTGLSGHSCGISGSYYATDGLFHETTLTVDDNTISDYYTAMSTSNFHDVSVTRNTVSIRPGAGVGAMGLSASYGGGTEEVPSEQVAFSDNTVEGPGTAIMSRDYHNVTVENNTISSVTPEEYGYAARLIGPSSAAGSGECVIQDNTVTGKACGLYAYKCQTVTVTGNNIKQSGQSLMYSLHCASCSYVRFTSNVLNECFWGIHTQDCAHVLAWYNELNNTSCHAISAYGDSGDMLVARNNNINKAGAAAITCSTKGIIENNDIEAANSGVACGNNMAWILDNNIRGPGTYGVSMGDNFGGAYKNDISGYNYGIRTQSNGKGADVLENKLTSCETGISASGFSGSISRNTVVGSTKLGIYIGGSCFGPSVTDNHVEGCDKGIYCYHTDADIARNTFTNNRIGMDILGNLAYATPTIHHNRIYGNSEYGVYNFGPADCWVGTKDDWWGHDSGPNPPGLGDRKGPRVSLTGFKGVLVRRRGCGHAGEPVNTAMGTFDYVHGDLSLPGRGLPLDVTRSYNSADPSDDSPLGHGWSMGYICHLDEESYYVYDDTTGESGWETIWVTLVEGGAETMFTAEGEDLVPQKGCFDTLTRDGADAFILTRKDHTVLHFEKAASKPAPNTVRYMLTSVTDPNGNLTAFAYTGDKLETVTDPGGRTLAFTWEGGHITEVADGTGRAISFAYDAGGDLTTFTDANGESTTYSYDPPHYLTRIIEPGDDVFLENHYDQELSTGDYPRVDWQKDGNGDLTTFSYDVDGRVTTVVEPGHTEPRVHLYDGEYHLLEDVSPGGNSTTYRYDEYGNRDRATDPEGNVTNFTYDERGNLHFAIDAEGNVTSLTYDTADNLETSTNALSHTTAYDYDASNNLARQDYPDPRGAMDYTYWTSGNGLGQVKTSTDSQEHKTSYNYDTYGNLSQAEDPLLRKTDYRYNARGLLSWTEDPLDHKTSFDYDRNGNLSKVKDPLHPGDPTGHHCVEYTYHPDNTLGSFTDANSNTTSYTYDGNNQLAGVVDPLGKSTTYTYDENWNLERIADARPEQYETLFIYDDDSRLTSIDDPSEDPPVTFDYYDNGLLGHVNQPTGEVTGYTYYANNLVHTITNTGSPLSYAFTYTPNNQLKTATDNEGRVTSLAYDTADRLISATDHNNPSHPGGFTASYTYDDLSQLIGLSHPGLSETMSYTAAGELDLMTIPAGTIDFSYYPDGKVNGVTTPDGTTRSYTYDAAGRITGIENSAPSGTDTTTYTHDNNGNVRRVNGAETYRYDELNRLTWWEDPGSGTIAMYSYDEVGNLTEVKEDGVTTRTFTYNGSNEITTTGYTYDHNGNMTSDGESDYTYDAMNRLTEVADHGTQQTIATYAYDHQGRRTSKTTGGATTRYHWDGNNLIAETNASGTVKATYTYDDVGNPVSMTRGGQPYFYQTNSHGDVTTLTNASGQVVNNYTYDPWGKVTQESETVENPVRYAGYLYDSETGMYYLMARYYDPGIGRFLSRDDWRMDRLWNCYELNLYVYCGDNPVRFTDKTGRFWLWDTAIEIVSFIVPVYSIIELAFYVPAEIRLIQQHRAHAKLWGEKDIEEKTTIISEYHRGMFWTHVNLCAHIGKNLLSLTAWGMIGAKVFPH